MKLRVAGVQVVNKHVATNKEQLTENVLHACSTIRKHNSNCTDKIDLFVLCELSSSTYDERAFNHEQVVEDTDNLSDCPSFVHFSALAKEIDTHICFGFIRKLASNKKTVSQAVINNEGNVEIIYNKQHLCSFGDCKESDYFSKGECKDSDMCFKINGVTIGIAICYDVRFPEYFRHLAKLGCDLVCHCSSFPYDQYSNTWPMFVQTRALENQYYILSVNQSGGSLFVPPWIIHNRYETECASEHSCDDILVGEVDTDVIEEMREVVPLRRDSGCFSL